MRTPTTARTRRGAIARRSLLALGIALTAGIVPGTAEAGIHITVPPFPPHNGTGQPGKTKPPASCDPRSHGYQAHGTPGVTAQAGALQVSWQHLEDPDVTAYRVAAVPQKLRTGSQPAVQWMTVKPPSGCIGTVSVTVGGLARKAAYDVWLDVVVKRRVGGSGTRDLNLGRSGVVWTK